MFKNQNGLSLLEIMLGLGMMAAGSLAFMQMNKNQIKSQKRVEESAEIRDISNAISQSLVTSEGCLNSIGSGTTLTDGMSINSISNYTGQEIIKSGEDYGSGMVTTDSIVLENINYAPEIDGKKKGSGTIRVTFVKNSKIVQGSSGIKRTIFKRYPVSFIVNAADNSLESCFDTASGAVETAVEEACKSIAGVLANDGACVLEGYDGTEKSYVAVSTAHLATHTQNLIKNELDPKYLESTGDQILTGSLKTTSDLITDTRICIGGKCRTFDEIKCANPGEALVSIDSSGNPVCINSKVLLAQSLCSAGAELKRKPAPDNTLYCDEACVITSWKPNFAAADICEGTSQIQTSNCGTTRTVNGTKGSWEAYTGPNIDLKQICTTDTVDYIVQQHSCTSELKKESRNGLKDCSVASKCPARSFTDKGGMIHKIPEGDVGQKFIVHGIETLPYDCSSMGFTSGKFVSQEYECADGSKTAWKMINEIQLCGIDMDSGDYCKDRFGPTATGDKLNGCCWTNSFGAKECQ